MIEIITKDWPVQQWYDVINWCLDTFGPPRPGEWMWSDDYSLHVSKENAMLLVLRWQ